MPTTLCQRSVGLDTSLKPKYTKFRTIFCSRTTRAQFFLEKNGKASSSKRTKHVDIWYFFITNRIDKGNVSLVCMTKPLQGALFWKFRDQIMGVVPAQERGPGKAITKIVELNTHTVKPTKGNELKPSRGSMYNLVPSKEKGWNHRKCNKQVTTKQQTRFSLTSIN